MNNPYLTEYNALPRSNADATNVLLYGAHYIADHYQHRDRLVKTYAWAIPTEEAIRAIAQYGSVIELGAGTGYWAALLTQVDCDVLAYDSAPFENDYTKGNYFPVQVGSIEKLAGVRDRTLLLCWPPYNTDMAAQALAAYEGATVAYVGEGSGGCTGDDAFHAALDAHWTSVASVTLPQWYGIHDSLEIYERND